MVDNIEHVNEVWGLGIYIEYAGQNLALIVGFSETGKGADLISWIVVFFEFAQMQVRPIVHGYLNRRAGIVFDGNLLEVGNETDVLQGLFVLLHILIGLGRTLVIVKGDAGRDHVKHDRAFVSDRSFQHGAQLAFVSGKRAADQSRAQVHGQRAGVDRREVVQHPAFQLGAQVGCG